MRTTVIPCLLVLLSACVPSAQDDATPAATRIVYQLTGNDGAATGQIADGQITPNGQLACNFYPADVPDWDPLTDGVLPPPLFRDYLAPLLYAQLAALVRTHGQPATYEDRAEGVFLIGPDETLAILPGPEYDGHASVLGAELIRLVDANGRTCMPFG